MNSYHVSFPGLGIENLPIHRIAFNLHLFGHDIAVYYYGITFALGFLLALMLALRHARRFGIDQDDLLDYFLLAVPFSLIGARLYYVAFTWESFRDNPLRILNTRYGGMAYYGGVIGGILAFWLMSRIKKMNFLHLLDYFAPYLALGQGIGRWGNFFNQEAFGENTTLPWGMFSEGTQAYLEAYGHGLDPALPVHPTFLYEFLGNLLIFFILLRVRKKKKFVFEVSAWYFMLYGLLRFFVEGIRVDALMWGNIRVSRLLSLLLVLFGLAIILIRRWQLKQGEVPMPPVYREKARASLNKETTEEQDLS